MIRLRTREGAPSSGRTASMLSLIHSYLPGLGIDVQGVVSFGDDPFDQRLLRIPVDNHDVAPFRRVVQAGQNQAIVIHQRRLHGFPVHPNNTEQKGKDQHHADQGEDSSFHPFV